VVLEMIRSEKLKKIINTIKSCETFDQKISCTSWLLDLANKKIINNETYFILIELI
jgi:hypothetical protein